MQWLLRKCSRCGRYTLRRDKCPECGGELYVPHPSRFSPDDKYVALRLKMKIEAKQLDLNTKPYYYVE